MAAELELYLDIDNQRLVKNLNNSEGFTIPTQFQGSRIPLRIFPVRPRYTTVAPLYELIAIDNLTLRAHLGPRAGATAMLVSQETWSKQLTVDGDGKYRYFYADFDLNTTELNNAIGSAETYSTFFEIQIASAGNWRPVYQAPFIVTATVRDPTGAATLPTPAASYPTWEQAKATFVKFENNPGERVVLKFGSWGLELGVDSNGSAIMNAIAL